MGLFTLFCMLLLYSADAGKTVVTNPFELRPRPLFDNDMSEFHRQILAYLKNFVGASGFAYMGYKGVSYLRRRLYSVASMDHKTIEDIKIEQEEIWSTITALHSMQSELKTLIEANNDLNLARIARLENLLMEKLGIVSSRVTEIEESCLSLDAETKKRFLNISEGLANLDVGNVEIKLQNAAISMNSTLAEYEIATMRKLTAFRDDLKKILRKIIKERG